MNPLLDLVFLLRPKATLWGSIRAGGHWSLSFPDRHDLIFFRVDRGKCMLFRVNDEPLRLKVNDVVLARTSVPIIVGSDPHTPPVDSWSLVASTRSRTMRVGDGRRSSVVVQGGRFSFDTANHDLLTGLLPEITHIPSKDASSDRVRTLLTMNEAEVRRARPESRFIVGRLVELLLIEVLRCNPESPTLPQSGLLAGLRDPLVARALTVLHDNIAQRWTTARLAHRCGMSRSALSKRFTEVIGVAPMSYLQQWRLAIAKDELRRGRYNMAQIAELIGFQSGNAFSTAFTRKVGQSPSRFAAAQNRLT